jgi:hypothetical protein
MMDRLHAWMIAQRDLVPEGSAISRALDYSLKRWAALSRYLDDGVVPIDNNWAKNQIRPWALGRKNWLFAGSRRSGKRTAAIMSLHCSRWHSAGVLQFDDAMLIGRNEKSLCRL